MFLWYFADKLSWIADRFQQVADWCQSVEVFGVRFMEWASDIFRGIAYAFYEGRDAVRSADIWLEDKWAILGNLVDFAYQWLSGRVQDLKNTIDWIIAQGWGALKGVVDWIIDQFNGFRGWFDNSFLPWLNGQLSIANDWLNQRVAELGSSISYITNQIEQLFNRIDVLAWINEQRERILYLTTNGWNDLSHLLTDPVGTIWAWISPTLLRKAEDFLRERWDTRL